MEDRNDFRKYGNIRVRYDTLEERDRAVKVLEARGFTIPEDLKDPSTFSRYGTNLLDINIRWKKLHYDLPVFVCACMGSSGVRLYTVEELERIAELKYRAVPRFPLFHVPHDGSRFPEELAASACVPAETLRAYHEQMRDKDVRQLIPRTYRGGQMICTFPVSRLLCDVERFTGPEETMERYGMGFCYEKAYDGTVIKRVPEDLKEKTRTCYDAHHREMDGLCERHPRTLLFDLHSYHDAIVPADFLRPGVPTPDLCVGTDPRYTPPRLAETVWRRFTEIGLSVAENYPYAGFFVPDSVMDGSSPCDLAGVMLEFHRRAYLDGNGAVDQEKAERIRRAVRRVMADCVDLA